VLSLSTGNMASSTPGTSRITSRPARRSGTSQTAVGGLCARADSSTDGDGLQRAYPVRVDAAGLRKGGSRMDGPWDRDLWSGRARTALLLPSW